MIPQNNLRRFRAGNAFNSEVTAGNLNAPLDVIDGIRMALTGAGIGAPDYVGMLGYASAMVPGIVTNVGPDGEADGTGNVYWVKLAKPDPAVTQGEEIDFVEETAPNIGGIVAATNMGETNTTHLLPTDGTCNVFLFRVVTQTGVPTAHYFFYRYVPGPGVLFRCKLTQTGGSNGNKTTAATWTYTVKDLDDVTLGTSKAPEWPRPYGTMTAATMGIAYYDGEGNVQLSIAFEKPGTGGCA